MTTASITPPETELPPIISVDDHILEPRDALAGRELPAVAARPRPAGRAREGRSSSFKGGHYGFTRDDARRPLVRPLAVRRPRRCPPACCTRPAGVPPEEQRERPGDLRGLPPGHLRPEGPPRSTWTTNHVEVVDQLPEHVPALRRARASPSAPTRTSRSRCLQIYNDWMIDEWCGGDGARPPHPADARARSGTRSSPPPRCGAARRRAATRSRSARTRRSSASRRSTAASGTCCGTRAWRPTPRCRCTSARRRRMPDHVRRRAARHVDVAQLAERRGLAVRLGVLAHARALPRRSRSRTPRARSAGCRSCSSAWTSCGTRTSAASSCPNRPSSVRERAACSAASSTTCTACSSRDAVGARARSCSRPTTRTPTARGPNSRAVAHRLCAAAGMDADECYKFLRGNAIRVLRPRPLRHREVARLTLCDRGSVAAADARSGRGPATGTGRAVTLRRTRCS